MESFAPYQFGISLTESKYGGGGEFGYDGLWKSILILGLIALVVTVYVIWRGRK
jgi:hypothetical protein